MASWLNYFVNLTSNENVILDLNTKQNARKMITKKSFGIFYNGSSSLTFNSNIRTIFCIVLFINETLAKHFF